MYTLEYYLCVGYYFDHGKVLRQKKILCTTHHTTKKLTSFFRNNTLHLISSLSDKYWSFSFLNNMNNLKSVTLVKVKNDLTTINRPHVVMHETVTYSFTRDIFRTLLIWQIRLKFKNGKTKLLISRYAAEQNRFDNSLMRRRRSLNWDGLVLISQYTESQHYQL